jgi:hypothetical protein
MRWIFCRSSLDIGVELANPREFKVRSGRDFFFLLTARYRIGSNLNVASGIMRKDGKFMRQGKLGIYLGIRNHHPQTPTTRMLFQRANDFVRWKKFRDLGIETDTNARNFRDDTQG